jgi:DNA-binding GntR family transcriptional regulator
LELLDRQDYRKLYVQLYEIILKKIEDKEWPVGFQIPIEQELCNVFKVSRATVRSAISELARQGYLTRQQGRGTFVSKKVISDKLTMFITFGELKKSLFELLEKKYGIHITGARNYFDVAYLDADEGRLFDLSESSPALVLTQHFFSGETQIMYMRSIKQPGRLELLIEFEKKG